MANKKNLLHLNAYYIDNHLYSQLFAALDVLYHQKVYIPIKYNREPTNIIDFENTELFFDQKISKWDKFNFFWKNYKLTKSLIKKGLHKNTDFVHAHNLFIDGSIAYKLKKKFGIPYIVAVRTTDIGLQYRLMKQRRPFIHKVLHEAEGIIFISPAPRDRFFSMLSPTIKEMVSQKTSIIPNGIAEYWFQNITPKKTLDTVKEINLMYVGQIR